MGYLWRHQPLSLPPNLLRGHFSARNSCCCFKNRQSGDLTFWTGSGTSYEAVLCPSKMANPSRKRLKADLFSPKLVNAGLTAKKQLSVETDSHVAFFQSKDLTTVEITKETDVLLILMSKLTLNALLVLKSAINHVPPAYSMRCKDFHCVVIIYKMMATCASACCLTLSDLYFYVSFLERHCPYKRAKFSLMIEKTTCPSKHQWSKKPLGE